MLYVTDQGLGEIASVNLKNVMLVKGLLTAREILLEELQKLSKVVDQAIDISEFVSKTNSMKLLNSVLQANQFTTDVEISGQGKPQIGLEVLTFISCCRVLLLCLSIYIVLTVSFLLIVWSLPVQAGNSAPDFLDVAKFDSLSMGQLLDCFHTLGDQLSYLWNIFLKFHRFAFYHVSLKFNKNVSVSKFQV